MCNNLNGSKSLPMVFIEGNVGVGKSTFLHLLEQRLGLHVFYEPNNLWQDVEGHDLLEYFFKDQKRWAYTLQSYVLQTRIDQLLEADTSLCHKICLVERSIYSGRYCFAQVAKEIHTMTEMEWCLYKKFWNREHARVTRTPAGFIYLRTPAKECLQRISHRGRFEEQPITLDYLQRIEEKHENWFIKKIGMDETILSKPVLILDFDKNITTNSALQDEYCEQVSKFIERLRY